MREELSRCRKALSDWIDLSLHISFRSHFRYFRKLGLSHSQISTLHMLSHKKECTVGDVSRILSISNPAASQLLDHLVNMGAIERYESSEDRRIRLHKLTTKGKKMMKQGHSVKKDWYQSLIEGMTTEELRKTTEVLELLNSRIKLFNEYDGKHRHGECE